jgi:hypothetical protein
MNSIKKRKESKESDLVPRFLSALRDKDEGMRLKAVSELGKIGGPQALSLLLLAIRDDKEKIKSTALACLKTAGVEEVDAKRVTMVFKETTPSKEGVIDWSEGIKQISEIMNLPALAAGLNPMSVFGSINRSEVGFLFDDKQKALEAALETKKRVTVFIWSDGSMANFNFGSNTEEAFGVAKGMKAKGATAFATANCDPSLVHGLTAILH